MLLPVGNPLVPYETPYHVTELLLQYLKVTFNALTKEHPFYYDPDNYDDTRIVFDTVYNKESRAIGKPLIIVARGVQNTDTTILGDLTDIVNAEAGHQRDTHYTNTLTATVDVRIMSKNFEEAEILAQHVYGFMMCARTVLNKYLHIHMIQGIQMSPAQRMDKDTENFTVQVTMSYMMQSKWHELTPARLSEFLARIKNADGISEHTIGE